MVAVTARALPGGALIERHLEFGDYTDCFVATVPGHFSQPDYIEAFYASWLFRLERLALTILIWRPSTDRQARDLARGERDSFAAWSVEGRTASQILLCDYQGLTRSWLMSETSGAGEPPITTLYFGTVVTRPPLRPWINTGFRFLSRVHGGYARALLRAAAGRLLRRA